MSLTATIKSLDKRYGKGTLSRLDDKPQDIEVIPTGSLGLDIALGVGGYPRGRIIEIFGPEASGKTTLAMHAVAQAQMMGLKTAIIDAEHALDPRYTMRLGVNPNDLYLAQPTTAEEALDITDELVRSQEVGLIIVDSVAAMTPKAELNGEIGDSHMGLMARLMGQAMRMLTANIKASDTTVIFINQIRHKIGVMFGSPEVTTGGNALKFYASQRLDIRRRKTLTTKDGVPYGTRVEVKVKKNKVAAPFNVAAFNLYFDHGIDMVGELVELAVSYGVVQQNGSWYAYEDEKLGQGAIAAGEGIMEIVGRADEIRSRIIKIAKGFA